MFPNLRSFGNNVNLEIFSLYSGWQLPIDLHRSALDSILRMRIEVVESSAIDDEQPYSSVW